MTQSTVLPPGTILQLMHVRERLTRIKPGVFVEVGPGTGEITALLLELGWRGTAYDLSTETVESLQNRFSDAIRSGTLVVAEADFCTLVLEPQSVNLVISSMVIEHLDDATEALYFEKARACLTAGGVAIHLVPAHMRYWGIEDDIRALEAKQDFGIAFVALARAVYFTNDERAAVKRAINERHGSAIVEEKLYASYGDGTQASERLNPVQNG